MNFTTNSGRSMTFDHEKWVISESRFCNVIGEEDAHVLLPIHVTSEVNLIIKINHHHNLVVVGNGK
jgi:hypothetical protein